MLLKDLTCCPPTTVTGRGQDLGDPVYNPTLIYVPLPQFSDSLTWELCIIFSNCQYGPLESTHSDL